MLGASALENTYNDVYYESMKRELNKRLLLECRCDTRLKSKVEGSTRLTWVSVNETNYSIMFLFMMNR